MCAPAPPKHPGTPGLLAGFLISSQPRKEQAPLGHLTHHCPHTYKSANTPITHSQTFAQGHMHFRLSATPIGSTGRFCREGNEFLLPFPTHTHTHTHTHQRTYLTAGNLHFPLEIEKLLKEKLRGCILYRTSNISVPTPPHAHIHPH